MTVQKGGGMNAGIFLRLSKAKGEEEDSQAAYERYEAHSRALCERRGWNVAVVYREPIGSAYQPRQRATFRRALADLRSGRIEVLVAIEWARLSRNRRDNEALWELVENHGAIVATADGQDTTTRSGRQALEIKAMTARWESDEISERVRRQQEQAAKSGGPPPGGRRLLGYGPRRETIIEREAEFVREAARRLLAGRSLRSVTAWANTTGVTSTTGREWSLQTLRGTLLSPGLAGRRVYRGVDFAEGRWEPILDRATHEMLVAILNDPAKRTRGPGVKHLLSGLVVCGRDGCEAPLMTHYARPGRREYWCQANKGLGRPGCGRTVVAAEPLERVVTSMVLKRLSGPGLARALAAEDDDPGAAAELKAAETRRDEIEHLYNSGEIRQDAFLRMHGPAVERVDKARDRLRAQASQSVLAELPTAKAELEAWWTAAQLDQRRAVIQAVVDRVVVGPAEKPSRTFNVDRIRPPFGPVWRDRRRRETP
jgi:DNA invertase Pin-like site-specific DNA recombinase